jgi:hypothetical protein
MKDQGKGPAYMRKARAFFAAALVALVGAGCNGTSNTTAATTTTTRTTETFSGTVTVGGRDVHNFSVTATGAIDVTLTAATPSAPMGISVGIPADGKCPALAGASTTASAGTTAQLSGLASAGTLCVDVHDAGSQPDTVIYTISITHP